MRAPVAIHRMQGKIVAKLGENPPYRSDANNKHTYFERRGGIPLPGATEVLKLFNFAGNAPADKMEDARVVGDHTHSAIDKYFKTDKVTRGGIILAAQAPVTEFGVADVRTTNCLTGAQDIIIRAKMEPVATELVLASELLGFGGTIDWFGPMYHIDEDFAPYGLTIADWKTGIIKFEDYVQQELYAMLVWAVLRIRVQSTLLISLSKTGEPARIVQCPDRAKAIEFAKQILKTYRMRNDFKELVDRRRTIKVTGYDTPNNTSGSEASDQAVRRPENSGEAAEGAPDTRGQTAERHDHPVHADVGGDQFDDSLWELRAREN